jgi:predicted nucleotidyltransferase
MKCDEAIRRLSEHREELKRRGVERLYLFGSTARDEAGSGSDVDLIIRIDRESRGKFGLFDLIRVKHYLEDTLDIKVDLTTEEGIKPQLKERIMGERIPIA